MNIADFAKDLLFGMKYGLDQNSEELEIGKVCGWLAFRLYLWRTDIHRFPSSLWYIRWVALSSRKHSS